MTLDALIEIVSNAYEDGWIIKAYAEDRNGEHGDGLARFIAVEIEETFDPTESDEEQINEAYRVMANAHCELEQILNALALHRPSSQLPKKCEDCNGTGSKENPGSHFGIVECSACDGTGEEQKED